MSGPVPGLPRYGRPTRVVLALAAGLGLLGAAISLGALWRCSRPLKAINPRPFPSTLATQRQGSFSPDGTRVAFVSEVDGVSQVVVSDLAGDAPFEVTRGSEPCAFPRWTAGGDGIVFERGHTREAPAIWWVSTRGGEPRLLAGGTAGPARSPALSPDGARLAYFGVPPRLLTCAADGSKARPVAGVPPHATIQMATPPAFSPDGRWLTLVLEQAGLDLFVLPAEGGPARRLTHDGCEMSGPVWVPGGREIVFSSDRGGTRTLWWAPVSGGAPQPLTGGSGEDTEPEVSRDGQRLLYTATRPSSSLMVLDSTTGRRRPVLEHNGRLEFPAFSPDGERLAYLAQTEQGTGLFVVGTGGGGPRLVATLPPGGYALAPQWSPEGTSIVVQQGGSEKGFRRIALDGGSSTVVAPDWGHELRTVGRIDPTGRRIAYHEETAEGRVRTFVRDVETGSRTGLPLGLELPCWSPDGLSLAGFVADAAAGYLVATCPADGTRCTTLGPGILPMWSGDGGRLFFLRRGSTPTSLGLWVASHTGQGERLVAELDGIVEGPGIPALSRNDDVAWVHHNPSRQELRLADLVRR